MKACGFGTLPELVSSFSFLWGSLGGEFRSVVKDFPNIGRNLFECALKAFVAGCFLGYITDVDGFDLLRKLPVDCGIDFGVLLPAVTGWNEFAAGKAFDRGLDRDGFCDSAIFEKIEHGTVFEPNGFEGERSLGKLILFEEFDERAIDLPRAG